MSCPTTPGRMLKRSLDRVVNRKSEEPRIQVIEDGGIPVHCGLMVSDPIRPSGCVFGNSDCMVEPTQRCDRSGDVYRIECETCRTDIEISDTETQCYIGMTRTSMHNRMLSHLVTQKSMCSKSPLYQHRHNGITQKYSMKAIGSEKKIVWLVCLEALKI